MKKLDVSELREGRELVTRINEILRLVKEDGETIEITDKGKIVAHVVPTNMPQKAIDDKLAASLRGIDELAAKIGARWKSNLDAVEAVRDVRDDTAWNDLKQIATELDPYWPENIGAVETIHDCRREV